VESAEVPNNQGMDEVNILSTYLPTYLPTYLHTYLSSTYMYMSI
jgi:hypothetical protein